MSAVAAESPSRRRRRPAGGAGRRRLTRLAAVQALYQADVNGERIEKVAREFLRHRLGQEIDGLVLDADAGFFGELVNGVAERRPELDGLIAETVATGRETERMEAVLRAILRAAVWELLARPDVPVRVVIKEYVDMTADFFSAREAGLANGVLDRLAHRLRPDELGSSGRDRADDGD